VQAVEQNPSREAQAVAELIHKLKGTSAAGAADSVAVRS